MRVYRLPPRLRLAFGYFVFANLLVALEVAIATRSPWWRLPYDKLALWTMASALTSFPLVYWATRGVSWAFHLLRLIGAAWVVATVVLAVYLENIWLGFFGLGLTIYLWLGLGWLSDELRRSFFSPHAAWYEGLPEPIPGVRFEIDAHPPFQVSRLDREGLFMMSEEPADLDGKAPLEGSIKVGEDEIRCTGRLTRSLRDGRVIGYRFVGLDMDTRKRLGDLVEVLKGAGVVV